MKRLLDQNLSRKLLPELESTFPGSNHVALLGLERADDIAVWARAREDGFVIVSRDTDFHQRSLPVGASEAGCAASRDGETPA